MPRWDGKDKAYFLRLEDDETIMINLMRINVGTGNIEKTADLSYLTYEGSPQLIYGYEIHGNTVYYCLDWTLLVVELDGSGGQSPPACLLGTVCRPVYVQMSAFSPRVMNTIRVLIPPAFTRYTGQS